MSFLIRAILFLVILWVVRMILAAFVGKAVRPRQPGPDPGAASLTVKDPVCGMYMDPRLAIRSGDHYFCSEDCLRKHTHA